MLRHVRGKKRGGKLQAVKTAHRTKEEKADLTEGNGKRGAHTGE